MKLSTRTEEEWQARERQLLEQNNRSLERAREAERRLDAVLNGRQHLHQPFEYDPNVDYLEERAINWVRNRIGRESALPAERALRLLEEAIELAHAESLNLAVVKGMVDHVYSRPKGQTDEEAGGVAACLYAYCGATGRFVSWVALDEIIRIEKRTVEDIQSSLKRKASAGLLTHAHDAGIDK